MGKELKGTSAALLSKRQKIGILGTLGGNETSVEG